MLTVVNDPYDEIIDFKKKIKDEIFNIQSELYSRIDSKLCLLAELKEDFENHFKILKHRILDERSSIELFIRLNFEYTFKSLIEQNVDNSMIYGNRLLNL